MKAKEYRLGNLAKDALTNETLICCGLNCDTDGKNTQINYSVIDRSKYPLPNGWRAEPIPLNKDWLLKFGFKRYAKEYVYYIKVDCYLTIVVDGDDFSISLLDFDIEDYGERSDYITPNLSTKHVHQLQNLYFALTGEELEIK